MRRARPDPTEDLPLTALTPFDVLCYVAGWHPPMTDRDRELSRWATWDQYLALWARVGRAVRASALPQHDWFVDRVLNYRQRYGPEALERARYDDLKHGD
jgi:hypothetical protein